VLRNKKQETALKLIKEFAGQWLGGYTVPFRTIKDFWSTVEKREAEVQYTREKPTLGPLISNLPYSYKMLPQAPRLTREEGYKREEPVKRQITGLTVKIKTPFEQEIDRLGIENLWPRTGNAKLDRMVLEKIGKENEKAGNILVNNPVYQSMDDESRQYVIKELISTKENKARQLLFPKWVMGELKEKKNKEDKFEFIKDLVDKGKFSHENFILFLKAHNRLFDKEQWDELLSKMFQREKILIQTQK